MAGKQEITADGDQTHVHQPSEGGDKMGGDSLFWITWIILASLQTFHVNVFKIHEFLIKKMSVYEMKGRQLLPAGCLA